MSDDGESKSSKLTRLSFILLNLRNDEGYSESEAILNAKYPRQGMHEEYSSTEYPA